MTFNQYQKFAISTAIYRDNHLWQVYPYLGLAGETGEVCEKIKKYIRGDGVLDKEGIIKELGDVLWYIANAALDLGVTLEEVAKANIDKLTARKAEGTIRGNGDDR